MEFNKYQTPVTEDELNELPQEIKEQFLDAINNIPFVKSMISPDRPRAFRRSFILSFMFI